MDFLIEENGIAVHYFVKPGEGLARQSARGSAWQPRECILRGAKDGFGLYTDGNTVHIVSADENDELIYLVGSDKNWRRFILAKLDSSSQILTIRIYPVRGRLNMLYSVAKGDDILLMHCILGNNARPHTVSKLLCDNFFVYGMRVYYTLADGRTGFCELADEKPDLFIRISDNCSVPYLHDGNMAYTSCGRIYFNNREIAYDEGADGVIITETNGQLFVAWKSGDFVKYVPTDRPNARAHCIINPAREAQLFAVWRGEFCEYFYGSSSTDELVTYINPAPFGSRQPTASDSMRRRLEEMKKEIAMLKKQLAEFSAQ